MASASAGINTSERSFRSNYNGRNGTHFPALESSKHGNPHTHMTHPQTGRGKRGEGCGTLRVPAPRRVRLRCTGFPSANSTTVIYVAHRVNHVYYECTCLTFTITTVRHVYSTDTNMSDFYHYYRSIDRFCVPHLQSHQHIAKKKKCCHS